jgi:hypothetical protein
VPVVRLLRVTTWNVLHRVHTVNWQEPGLADASVHLVVLAAAPGARLAQAETFATDDGKGLLAVRAALGEGFALSRLEGQRPTRVAVGEDGSHTIDHAAVVHARLATATVLDGEGLSDHHPVAVVVALS